MSLNLSSDEEDLDEFIIPKSDEYLGSNVGKIIQANIDRAEKIIRFKAEGADVQYSEDNTAADEDDFVDSLDGSIDLNALTKNLLQKFNSVQRREGSSKDSNRRSGLTRISTQLMESSINSAKRTLTTRDEFLQGNKTNETSGNETPLLNSTPENTSIFKDVPRSSEKGSAKKGSESATKEASPYLSNPSITVTALSHSLWSSALDIDDCAIDATCGKGKDSAELADIMFSKPRHEGMYLKKELVCVDIQEQAVSCTEALIRDQIGNETFQKYVRVVQKSHFPLPEPQHNRKVGLICYNLGWLPGSSKKISTSMETTIKSLVDATRLVRVGGLITVVTYPGTSEEEARAVELFIEGLAMFTTRNKGGWEAFVLRAEDVMVREVVWDALKEVYLQGVKGQTWRSFAHRPLGRPLSPVLLTTTKIK